MATKGDAKENAKMEVSADARVKAKRQIEFYFSDSNLPRDVFMAGQIGRDPEGFVDISLLCTFKRMRDVLGVKEPDLKTESVPQSLVSVVAEALSDSQSLTLSEDKTRVRRTEPLTSAEAALAQIDQRSLYAAPFPYNTRLDAITEFFQQRSPVNCVRMRRHLESKDFRGSVFVEFADEEAMQKVLKEQLEYEGAPLQLEPKVEYVARKKAERKEKVQKSEEGGKAQAKSEAHAAHEGDEGAKLDETSPDPVPKAAEAKANGAEPMEEEKVAGKAEGKAEEEIKEGCLLGFDFGEAEHDLYYSNIKEALAAGDWRNIRFVEFQRGASSGVVRYTAPDIVEKALKLADGDGKLEIAGITANLRKIEEDEEKEFYERAAKQRDAKQRDAKHAQEQRGRNSGGRGRQKRPRGGRGRGYHAKRGRG